MKKKLGIFLIRGAGEEGSKEQQKFVENLNSLLKKRAINTDEIHYEYANWYTPTQNNQEKLLNRLLASGLKIESIKLRKFILFLISDLVAYIGEPNKPDSAYQKTHEQIFLSFQKMQDELEYNSPLIIISSSLGTEIISNYIWDRQNPKGVDPLGINSFDRMETLTGIFMFGTINPLYFPAYNIDEIKPFQFPSGNLQAKFKNVAYWTNIYDKNDPMGFPLKPINAFYNSMVSEDLQINSGGIFFSWNAASHLGYWKTDKIAVRVADYIKKVTDQI